MCVNAFFYSYPMSNQEFQTIHEIGIHSLMEQLKKKKGAPRDEILPVSGKNATINQLDYSKDKRLLSASGIFLEGIHYDLVYTPLKHLGYKLITAAVSHIYAMNGSPVSARIDLAVPNKISTNMLGQLFDGFDAAGKIYNSSIHPGDLTASHQILVVSVHVEGVVSENDLITMKGCKNGDQICVTGDLGGAMAGLRVLLREKKEWKEKGENQFEPDLQEYEYVVQRQLMPTARHDLGEAFSKTGVKPSGMVDVSQGLVNELQLIMEANNTGCEIFTPAVPVSLETRKVADEMKEDVDRYACYGGEDFEMLFTLKDEDVEKLRTEFEDFSVIGTIKEENEGIILNSGEGSSINLSDEN